MKWEAFAFVLLLAAQLAHSTPDLVPSMLNAEPFEIAPGQRGTLRVGIAENDPYPNPFDSQYYDVSVQAQGGVGVNPARRTLQLYVERQADFEITCPQAEGRREYALTISVDVDNDIRESNENNNVITRTLVCVPPPDLVVGAASAQPQAAHAGEQVQVEATIQNAGGGLNAQVRVGASVSGTPAIAAQTRDVQLSAQQPSNTAQFTFTCPQVQAYTAYIVALTADSNAQIAEANENNNVRTVAFGCIPAQTPRICRAQRNGANQLACESCVLECRLKLQYADPRQARFLYEDEGKTALCGGDFCADNACVYPCKKEVVLPNGQNCLPHDANAANDANCKRCNYDCRILENGQIPQECDVQGCAAQNCPAECKIDVANLENAPPVCMPYLGNGQNPNAQNAPDVVKIADRQAPFNNPAGCRQCPEQYRILGDEGNGGLDPQYYDCSVENCPNACRIEIPPVQEGGVCRPYFDGFCTGCPLECRLLGVQMPDRQQRCAPCASCIEECKEEVEKGGVCDTYANCPSDCLGEPRVRTDCAEQCTEEELSGESKITPASFITKLGGAEGDADTKNVGTLMLPAIVLPLFSIVILVSFIRILSPILGGDVEIPGIARLI